MMCGAFGHANEANEEVQNIINQVRGEVEGQAGDLGEYRAVSYRSQVVAGMNYLVKVHLSGNHYCHVKVYVPLPYTGNPPSLSELETGKSLDDSL